MTEETECGCGKYETTEIEKNDDGHMTCSKCGYVLTEFEQILAEMKANEGKDNA